MAQHTTEGKKEGRRDPWKMTIKCKHYYTEKGRKRDRERKEEVIGRGKVEGTPLT